jgi:hypothetical protein
LDKIIGNTNVTEVEKRTMENCGISRETLVKMNQSKLSMNSLSSNLGAELLDMWDKRDNFFAIKDYVPEYKKSKSILGNNTQTSV